jgi:hypothetical protein
MNFIEKTEPTGHLTIVKIDKRTGDEEILYDDSNVICGGMGRSIAQFMSTPKCADDLCETEEVEFPAECRMFHYQLSHFQVGQGASGITPTSSVVSLVAPLTVPGYGANSLVSVNLESNTLWSEESIPIANQIFGKLQQQGVIGNKLVSLWLLDEETANNTTLDEAGLFVRNPYIKTSEVGGSVSPDLISDPDDDPVETYVDDYEPGRLLAAYKQFTPIVKENYFALLFRWSIDFG